MKLLLVVGLFLLAVGAFCELRVARVEYLEKCDKRYTPADCNEYASKKSKSREFCHTYTFSKVLRSIFWQRCGKIYCLPNTKLVEEDLSKPFPECCEHCEIIDPTTPAA